LEPLCEQNCKNHRNLSWIKRSVKQFLKGKSAFKNIIYRAVAFTQVLQNPFDVRSSLYLACVNIAVSREYLARLAFVQVEISSGYTTIFP